MERPIEMLKMSFREYALIFRDVSTNQNTWRKFYNNGGSKDLKLCQKLNEKSIEKAFLKYEKK